MATEKIQVLILGDDRKKQFKLIESFTERMISDTQRTTPFHQDTKVPLENPREAHDIFKSCWVLRDTPPIASTKIDPFFQFDNPAVLCLIDGSTDWDEKSVQEQLSLIKEKSFSRPLYFFIDKTDFPCEKLKNDLAYFTPPITLLVKRILGDEFPDPIVIYGSTANQNDVNLLFANILESKKNTRSKKSKIKKDEWSDNDNDETDEEKINQQTLLYINQRSSFKSYLDNAQFWIKQNPTCFVGNLMILIAAMSLLILAASPVGAFLALGTLSAIGSVALLGFGAWVLWNASCRLVEQLPLIRKPDIPNSQEDNPVKFNVMIEIPKHPELHIFSPDLTNKYANKTKINTNNDTSSDINSNKKQ